MRDKVELTDTALSATAKGTTSGALHAPASHAQAEKAASGGVFTQTHNHERCVCTLHCGQDQTCKPLAASETTNAAIWKTDPALGHTRTVVGREVLLLGQQQVCLGSS